MHLKCPAYHKISAFKNGGTLIKAGKIIYLTYYYCMSSKRNIQPILNALFVFEIAVFDAPFGDRAGYAVHDLLERTLTAALEGIVAVVAVAAVVSIMHFWYDGFVWSVRKQQV